MALLLLLQPKTQKRLFQGNLSTLLKKKAADLLFMWEYVPVNTATKPPCPGDKERIYIEGRIAELRRTEGMLCLSSRETKKASGGGLARQGFFHINYKRRRGALPVFAFSDTISGNISLLEALRSPLFEKLRDGACFRGTFWRLRFV